MAFFYKIVTAWDYIMHKNLEYASLDEKSFSGHRRCRVSENTTSKTQKPSHLYIESLILLTGKLFSLASDPGVRKKARI